MNDTCFVVDWGRLELVPIAVGSKFGRELLWERGGWFDLFFVSSVFILIWLFCLALYIFFVFVVIVCWFRLLGCLSF